MSRGLAKCMFGGVVSAVTQPAGLITDYYDQDSWDRSFVGLTAQIRNVVSTNCLARF